MVVCGMSYEPFHECSKLDKYFLTRITVTVNATPVKKCDDTQISSCRRAITPQFLGKLRDAFLCFTAEDASQKHILGNLQAAGCKHPVIHRGEGLRRVADRRTGANEFRTHDACIYPYLVPVKRSGLIILISAPHVLGTIVQRTVWAWIKPFLKMKVSTPSETLARAESPVHSRKSKLST